MLLKSTSWLLALALAIPVSVSAAQSGPLSLGEVVKQPKPAKRATRVITNDDFPERPPEPKPLAAEAAEDKASAPGAKTTAAATPGEHAADADAKARLAKRLAELGKAEESEQSLLERLQQALLHEGMSESQRNVLAEALGQSHHSLADYRDQKQTLENLLSAPAPKQPAAPEAAPDKQSLFSSPSPTDDPKPERP